MQLKHYTGSVEEDFALNFCVVENGKDNKNIGVLQRRLMKKHPRIWRTEGD